MHNLSIQMTQNPEMMRAQSNQDIMKIWYSCRQSPNECPSFAHFNTDTIANFAGMVFVLQPTHDGDFVYTYFGTKTAPVHGSNLTGRRHSELRYPVAVELTECFETVLHSGIPTCALHGSMRSQTVHTWEHLILPVESPIGRMLVCNLVPVIYKVALIESIVQSSPGAIMACSAIVTFDRRISTLRIVMANHAADRLFNQAEETLVGQNVLELMGPGGRVALENACVEVISAGKPISLKLDLGIRAGEPPQDLTISGFDGGLVLTFAELGTLRRAYEELERREQELARVTAELDRQSAALAALAEEITEARASYDREAGQRRRLEEELRLQAETDDLTGLMNRRAFFVQLQTEIARSVRYGHPPTLLYLDIDRFKQVNDSYGHAAGDAVIRAVIERIRSALRSGLDLVGRIGGDEFAILLPETQLAGAHVVAERIRQIVTEKPVLVIERIIPVTVSIGIAAWIAPEHPEQPSENVDDWVARADAALYNAKHRGRNQVCEAAPAGDSAPARATG